MGTPQYQLAPVDLAGLREPVARPPGGLAGLLARRRQRLKREHKRSRRRARGLSSLQRQYLRAVYKRDKHNTFVRPYVQHPSPVPDMEVRRLAAACLAATSTVPNRARARRRGARRPRARRRASRSQARGDPPPDDPAPSRARLRGGWA
jgi:hypothetical protein